MAEKKQENLSPSAIIADWKKDENYKTKMGFTRDWPEQVRFKEGKQWPPVTKNTKNIPRITVNKCDFIIKNKKSNILSRGMKIIFKPKEVPENMTPEIEQEINTKAQDYTDLAENTWNDIQQTQLNRDIVDDALTIGNGFIHYYMDTSYEGGQYVKTKGRLCAHTINAMDIALGNPHLKPHEIQKQPKIIIKTNEDVDGLKEYAKKNGENWQLIVPDNDNSEQYDAGKQDIQNPNKATCFTVYYKISGNVHWTKVTETAIIQKPIPLAPTGSKRVVRLYPVEHLVLEPMVKCVYGRSAIADSINIQKAINFLYSMIAYGVQQTAWPKILSKAGALIQGITNEPGEIIYDHDKNNPQDSIKYMQPPNFSNMPNVLIDKLTEEWRVNTGTTEVATGESMGANMAAQAIMALQNQAQKPVDMYIEILYDFMKRCGAIWCEFYKVYYILPRSVVSKDTDGNMSAKTITPSDYADMEFDFSIDIGSGGKLDEAGQQALNQMLYDKGDLTKFEFVRFTPNVLVPQGMKEYFEKQEEQMQAQAEVGQQADQIMSQLTPEEKAKLQQNPQIMDEVMGGMGNAV